jgi:hypothetical protein
MLPGAIGTDPAGITASQVPSVQRPWKDLPEANLQIEGDRACQTMSSNRTGGVWKTGWIGPVKISPASRSRSQ